MPKRFGLSIKLALAFLGVSVVTLALALVLIDRLTTEGFHSYVAHNEMMRSVMPGTPNPMASAEQDFLGRLRLSLILAGLGGALVATIAGIIVAGYITRPLRQIEEAARSLARGDTSRRAPVTSGDELGELATSFNAMAESLASQERIRQQFIADVSHELRTPLAVLQGEIEALQDGVTQPSKERLASLYEETQLLTRLVDDLRTLSLADTGELKLQLQTEPVADFLKRGVSAMAEAAARENVAFRLDLDPGLPAVTADAHRISQVLINLLSNAIRHTLAGGEVCVSAQVNGDVVRVRVRDSGSGIPAEALPHIFDRFYRVDPSRTRSSGGSGLGLAISRQLIQAHGGDIWAENNEGRGVTVTFTLPVATDDALNTPKRAAGLSLVRS
jgi:signal transduction histidine kinase